MFSHAARNRTTQRIMVCWVSVLALLFSLLVVATPASAATHPSRKPVGNVWTDSNFRVGVVDNCHGAGTAMCSPAGYALQAKIWHDAGIKFVRTWVNCNTDGHARWNQDLKYYVAQGIMPILDLACGSTFLETQNRGFARWYAGFTKDMAAYGIHSIEVGNEMNGNTQWKTTDTAGSACGKNKAKATDYAKHVHAYVQWLAQVYHIAHWNDPKAVVISGGVEYATTTSWCIVPSKLWIEQMVREGADRYFDAFGYHPYSQGAQGVQAAIAQAVNSVRAENYDAVKAQMGKHDKVPARPMWITEVGFCIKGASCAPNGRLTTVNEMDRARLIKPFFDGLRRIGFDAPVIWYWGAGDGYGLIKPGSGKSCNFGATRMGGYAGIDVTSTLCSVKKYNIRLQRWHPKDE